MGRLLELDKKRYGNSKMPKFQAYFRKFQDAKNPLLKLIYRVIYRFLAKASVSIQKRLSGISKKEESLINMLTFCVTVYPAKNSTVYCVGSGESTT